MVDSVVQVDRKWMVVVKGRVVNRFCAPLFVNVMQKMDLTISSKCSLFPTGVECSSLLIRGEWFSSFC